MVVSSVRLPAFRCGLWSQGADRVCEFLNFADSIYYSLRGGLGVGDQLVQQICNVVAGFDSQGAGRIIEKPFLFNRALRIIMAARESPNRDSPLQPDFAVPK